MVNNTLRYRATLRLEGWSATRAQTLAPPAEPELRVDLLGGLAVSAGGRTIPAEAWTSRKAQTLLKLLALAPGHALHREQLWEALWPDRPSRSARQNLHQAIYVARRAIEALGADPQRALVVRDELVALSAAVDVDRFEALARTARREASVLAYRRALAHYRGDLLPEDRLEPWAVARSEMLRQLHVELLVEVAELHRECGAMGAAIEAARRAIAEDELHEPAYRTLMRLLADSGRRQEALAAYERLRTVLRATLEADADPETRRLYRELLAGSLERAA